MYCMLSALISTELLLLFAPVSKYKENLVLMERDEPWVIPQGDDLKAGGERIQLL